MARNGNGVNRHSISIGTVYPLIADAVAALLSREGYAVAERHTSGAVMRETLLQQPPTIALIDFEDGGPSSLDILRDLRHAQVPTRIILFVPSLDGGLPIDAVELGVDGLLLRTAAADTVLHCVATVADGGQWLDPRAMKAAYDRMSQRHAPVVDPLTRRERDVARLVATGQRNRVIATQLGISEGTVKMHLHNVYAKLGLESRTQLAMDVRLRESA